MRKGQTERLCMDGPFKGYNLWIHAGATLWFKCGDWEGRYVAVQRTLLKWEQRDSIFPHPNMINQLPLSKTWGGGSLDD